MRPAPALFLLPLLAVLPPVRAQSLWLSPANSERSMFSDHKAGRVGDILTVVVQESAVTQSSKETKSSRSSDINAAVTSFLFPPAASALGTHNGALPSTGLGAKNDFDGSGQINNSQSISARAAVLVVDTLPNGNLVIAGMRQVTFSGETQYIILHGLVRPDDVAADNTVLSSNIADAHLEFVSEGQLTDAQKRGWLTKLYDKLRPY